MANLTELAGRGGEGLVAGGGECLSHAVAFVAREDSISASVGTDRGSEVCFWGAEAIRGLGLDKRLEVCGE